MRVRRFNDDGLRRFGEFLDSAAGSTVDGKPEDLLIDESCSSVLDTPVPVVERAFSNRLDLARHLADMFPSTQRDSLLRDRGVWAWLTLFYFDQLCPPDRNGLRRPGARARWIPELFEARRYYRHLLLGPLLVYLTFEDAPDRALSLLCTPVSKPGEIFEQLASRQELVTNRTVVEVATRLYVDSRRLKPKHGAAGKGAGSPRRFARVLGQFDVTWDLYGMTSEALLSVLPAEFDKFRT